YTGLYELRAVPRMTAFAVRLPAAVGLALLLLVPVYAVFPSAKMTEDRFLWSSLTVATLLMLLRGGVYAYLRSPLSIERVLIVGTSPLARVLIEEIEAQPHLRYAIVGVAADVAAPGGLPLRYPL